MCRLLLAVALAFPLASRAEEFCADKQGLIAAPANWPGNIDCRGYFNCWRGDEAMLFCAVGTMFDPAIKNCQWASQLEWACGSQQSTTSARTITASTMASTTVPATTASVSLSTTSQQSSGNKGGLVAFVENWMPCPSTEKIKGYTKVIVSFAVSYTWQPQKNLCDSTCTIGSPVPICNNAEQPGLVNEWKEAGVTVLLSFGGAGMGGSWAGDVNDCWESCFDRVDSVVSQLTTIVSRQGFDGVDIDYEYFLTTRSAAFLVDLTTKLKVALGSSKIVSHAPMDSDLDAGDMYFNVLKDVAPFVDYVLPQYYNGFLRPANDLLPVLNHFGDLVHEVFGGDESKVIFGFCISVCGNSNVDGAQAAQIIQALNEEFPNNGGAFFWAASNDVNGAWSQAIAPALGLAAR